MYKMALRPGVGDLLVFNDRLDRIGQLFVNDASDLKLRVAIDGEEQVIPLLGSEIRLGRDTGALEKAMAGQVACSAECEDCARGRTPRPAESPNSSNT